MTDVETNPINVDELTTPQKGGSYEEWAKRKIKDALEHDIANPDERLTQAQMWEKHGLAR